MKSHFCETCNKTFSTTKIFKKHLETKGHNMRITPQDHTIFKCICLKSFTTLPSLSRHRKTCTVFNPPQNNTTHVIQLLQERLNQQNEEINKKDEEMRQRLDKKDKEMDELRKQVEALIGKSPKNTTNNIQTQNNIENQSVNIVVNSFGHENIDHLTDQIICKIIKTAPFTSVPQLIEKIHFDPDHPENHNIKITNKKLNYAEIVRDNKWVTANKKKVIDDVIQKSYELLDEKYSENKADISEKRQERFQNFQEKYEQADEELLRNIKNDVDLLMING